MSSFTTALIAEKSKGRLWRVAQTFRYYVGEEGSSEWIDVPVGFTTDLASVPRLCWNLFPPDGSYTQAAVLHDFLYLCRGFEPSHIPSGPYSRAKVDAIFLEAMGVLGVGWLQRHVMYRAVRVGGPRW